MTFLSVADCCRRLAIDPKTLRRWLKAAHLQLAAHPSDGRCKGLPSEQLAELATAHRRTLTLCQLEPSSEPAPSRPEPPTACPALPAPTRPSSEQLSTLLTQLAAVQEQLAHLSQQLAALLPKAVAGPGQPAVLSQAAAALSPPAVLSAACDKQAAVQERRPRPPARVLPLVEYGRDGHYVLLCPKEGRLSFEPDSHEWFAWLESRSAFRFVGKEGHFTAHRESERLPNAVWRAHRKIRNHTCNQRLAHTPALTTSVLEQAAATLQAYLK